MKEKEKIMNGIIQYQSNTNRYNPVYNLLIYRHNSNSPIDY